MRESNPRSAICRLLTASELPRGRIWDSNPLPRTVCSCSASELIRPSVFDTPAPRYTQGRCFRPGAPGRTHEPRPLRFHVRDEFLWSLRLQVAEQKKPEYVVAHRASKKQSPERFHGPGLRGVSAWALAVLRFRTRVLLASVTAIRYETVQP